MAQAPPFTVAIVGAGYSGCTVARALDSDSRFHVVLFDKRKFFFNNIGSLRGCATGEAEHLLMPYNYLLRGGPKETAEAAAKREERAAQSFAFMKKQKGPPKNMVVHARVLEVRKDAREIVIEGRKEPLAFDFVVITTGSAYQFPGKVHWWIPKAHALRKFREAHAKIGQAKSILCIGGGPVACELSTEIKHHFPATKVTLVQRHPRLCMQVDNEKFTARLMKKMKKMGVEVVLNENAIVPEGVVTARPEPASLAAASAADDAATDVPDFVIKHTKITTESGNHTFEADLVLMCTGPRVANNCFRDTFKDSCETEQRSMLGSLKTDKHAVVLGTMPGEGVADVPRYFAAGDCACTEGHTQEMKLAYCAQVKGGVVAANIKKCATALTKGTAGKKPLKLKVYKPMQPGMFVANGPNGGQGYVFGMHFGNFLVRAIKAKDLGTPQMRSLVRAPKPKGGGGCFGGGKKKAGVYCATDGTPL